MHGSQRPDLIDSHPEAASHDHNAQGGLQPKASSAILATRTADRDPPCVLPLVGAAYAAGSRGIR
jgi:hypothetical protein